MKNINENRTVLITGVCGHLGTCLALTMLEKGFEVRGLVLNGEDSSFLDSRIKVYNGDVRDKESMNAMFEGTDNPVFIHAAAVISIKKGYSKDLYDINVGGTANVISLCKEHGVKKLVYIGSVDSLYSKGRNCLVQEVDGFFPEKLFSPYAKTKAMAARLVQASGLEYCIILPSGMIGPDDYKRGLMSMVFSLYLNGKLRAGVSGGFDFVDVRDVAKAVANASVMEKTSETYILSNTFSNTTELLNELLLLAGKKPLKTSLSVGFIKLVLPFAGLYFKLIKERNPLTMESTRLLGKNIRFSNEKAKKELGFSARPVIHTLKDFLSFARRQKWVTA